MPELNYPSVTIAPYDLHNITGCVPSDQFIPLMQMVVFKTEAIRLGCLCFIAGITFTILLYELDKRWKSKVQ